MLSWWHIRLPFGIRGGKRRILDPTVVYEAHERSTFEALAAHDRDDNVLCSHVSATYLHKSSFLQLLTHP